MNIEGHVLKIAGLLRNVCGSKWETVLTEYQLFST